MVPGASTEAGEIPALLAEHAPALLPLVQGDPSLVADVTRIALDREVGEAEVLARFHEATEGLGDGPELRRALRRLRHREMVRIALREVLRLADVEHTSAEMAALASAAIDAALAVCRREAEAEHGVARDAAGAPVPLVVLGMGKLGGRELNLGSDVDLCFFYGDDDAAVGDGSLSVHEHFTRITTRAVRALADVTEDGFCFRVDLRLRPEGSQGAVANSLASAERYYESFGRTWERAALLRARPVAGDLAFGDELLDALRPFVFRRTVDPHLPHELGELLRKTRRDLRVDEARDLKLGRGGIREAEWVVQALQLVWGGQHPELRVPGTMDALRRLHTAGLVSDREAETLAEGWSLLRRAEHRIQVVAGYQTHALPADRDDLDRLARSLGYRDGPALAADVTRVREAIAQLFATLDTPAKGSVPPGALEIEALSDAVAAGSPEIPRLVGLVLPGVDPDEAAAHLARMARRATGPLGAVTRERTPELGPLLLREVAESADPAAALRGIAEFFARLGGPWPYERLLVESPRLTRRLVGLFGASQTLSTTLIGHPEDVDLLLGVGGAVPTPAEISASHAGLAECDDAEVFVTQLRRIKRDVTLRVGLAHSAGELALPEVFRLLSALADAQIAGAFAFAEKWVTGKAPDPWSAEHGLVVCALGKLGGSELGFGGDLDLVFVHQGGDADEAERSTRIAQRTMRLLSQPDAEGQGYQTDTRLRPSGSHGMLVVSLAGFDAYHQTQAGAWERLALIRARPIAGDSGLAVAVANRFAELAFEGEPMPPADLAALRRRIQHELAGENARRYHAKLGHGGLVDVEFAVQSLQMRHGRDANVRRRGTGEALEALRRAGHITPADADAFAEGAAFFRAVEQAVKLLDESLEPALTKGGSLAPRIARRLGLRSRDGQDPEEVLFATWARRAAAVRAAFERTVAPVGLPAPWGG